MHRRQPLIDRPNRDCRSISPCTSYVLPYRAPCATQDPWSTMEVSNLLPLDIRRNFRKLSVRSERQSARLQSFLSPFLVAELPPRLRPCPQDHAGVHSRVIHSAGWIVACPLLIRVDGWNRSYDSNECFITAWCDAATACRTAETLVGVVRTASSLAVREQQEILRSTSPVQGRERSRCWLAGQSRDCNVRRESSNATRITHVPRVEPSRLLLWTFQTHPLFPFGWKIESVGPSNSVLQSVFFCPRVHGMESTWAEGAVTSFPCDGGR